MITRLESKLLMHKHIWYLVCEVYPPNLFFDTKPMDLRHCLHYLDLMIHWVCSQGHQFLMVLAYLQVALPVVCEVHSP